MKLKNTIFLIFLMNISYSQNYFLPKNILRDSVLLNQSLKQIVKQQNQNFKVKNNIDSLKTLIKQEVFLENYENAINTIKTFRKRLALNNWDGNKFFSFEIYAKAKIIESTKNKKFNDALDLILFDKINNLPENLLINLKKEIYVDYTILEKNKIDNINNQLNKDSIKSSDLSNLYISILDNLVLNLVNKKALKIYDEKIQEKFNIQNIDIVTSKGVKLTITIVRNKLILNPASVVLTNNIYAGDIDFRIAMNAAVRNYIGVVVNTRGKRNSENLIEPFEHESEDLYDVIDFISKQPWCNGKVGMFGGSYSGFSQWAAVKKLHPALKTIIPQASVGIGTFDFPMMNNVFRSYMLRWISHVTQNNFTDDKDFDNFSKWNKTYNEYYTKGTKFRVMDSISGKKNSIFQKWLNHPSHDDFWEKMTPTKKEFSKINIPILSTTGFFDADQTGVLHYFNQHNIYNKKANHYLVIGPYEHQSVQTFQSNDLLGYDIDDVAKINFTNLCFDWFDYILENKSKPEILKDKINVQIMGTNKWKHFNSIKKLNDKSLKFYLNNDKNSSVFEKKNQISSFTQIVDLKIRNEKRKYYNVGTDSIFLNSSKTIIESKILKEDIIINGSFTGKIKFALNKKDVDLAIDLIEVKQNGKIIYLSDYIGRASYAKDKSKRNLLKPNMIEEIPITNSSFISKKIEKGSKLILMFGVNKSRAWQINYGTGKDVSDESIEDANEPLKIDWYNDSYIQIPILEE